MRGGGRGPHKRASFHRGSFLAGAVDAPAVTLDPVHFDGIVRLAERIRPGVDPAEGQAFAETVWAEFLEPLRHDGTAVIEPLGERRRRRIPVEDAALQAEPFPTVHGLDSGTINPTTFKNGLVLDVAQAAMSAVPSDLELHRGRTVVLSVHANDVAASLGEADWFMDDEGYTRQHVLQVPRVDRFEQQVVHVLALYLAESTHALENADVVSDLLLLDGPLYPKGLLEWRGRDARLERLLAESERPRAVVENYLRLVERFVERDVPLCGFVKTPGSRTITRAVRAGQGNAPWVNDAAFFKAVLDPRREDQRGPAGTGGRDVLTATNWFLSRGGVDAPLSAEGDALGLERALDPAAYEVAFCMLYDPRADHLFRLEAPAAFARDAELRERLLMTALQGVAVQGGPPPAIAKADELARISRDEKAALRRALERAFETERERDYDTTRWGVMDGL